MSTTLCWAISNAGVVVVSISVTRCTGTDSVCLLALYTGRAGEGTRAGARNSWLHRGGTCQAGDAGTRAERRAHREQGGGCCCLRIADRCTGAPRSAAVGGGVRHRWSGVHDACGTLCVVHCCSKTHTVCCCRLRLRRAENAASSSSQ